MSRTGVSNTSEPGMELDIQSSSHPEALSLLQFTLETEFNSTSHVFPELLECFKGLSQGSWTSPIAQGHCSVRASGKCYFKVPFLPIKTDFYLKKDMSYLTNGG